MARARRTTKKTSSRKASTKKKTTKKKAASKKTSSKKTSSKKGGFQVRKSLPPKAQRSVKDAADALWDIGVPPHELLQELHEVMLLRCLEEAEGNYAGAAAIFGPSRQSVQQYANSPLRDSRWKQYQQNRRKKRSA